RGATAARPGARLVLRGLRNRARRQPARGRHVAGPHRAARPALTAAFHDPTRAGCRGTRSDDRQLAARALAPRVRERRAVRPGGDRLLELRPGDGQRAGVLRVTGREAEGALLRVQLEADRGEDRAERDARGWRREAEATAVAATRVDEAAGDEAAHHLRHEGDRDRGPLGQLVAAQLLAGREVRAYRHRAQRVDRALRQQAQRGAGVPESGVRSSSGYAGRLGQAGAKIVDAAPVFQETGKSTELQRFATSTDPSVR